MLGYLLQRLSLQTRRAVDVNASDANIQNSRLRNFTLFSVQLRFR